MDPTDLFEDAGKKQKTTDANIAEAIAETLASGNPRRDLDLPESLLQKARSAAQAHDSAEEIKTAYDNERDRIQKEVEERLADLKSRHDQAQEILDESVESLKEEMEESGITKIPMIDRPDIVLKNIPGRKKPITKKWLIGTYGSETAKQIWDAVPNYPDKQKVVVPDRYQDEPDLG